MPNVTVYQYAIVDPQGHATRIAPRWATRKSSQSLNRIKRTADILIDTETEINASYIERSGMTEVGFDPPPVQKWCP
jgi:hypothetical protein